MAISYALILTLRIVVVIVAAATFVAIIVVLFCALTSWNLWNTFPRHVKCVRSERAGSHKMRLANSFIRGSQRKNQLKRKFAINFC